MGKGVDALPQPILIGVNNQFHAHSLSVLITKTDHLLKFPGGIDVQQRERRLARIKGFQRQMEHHRGILTDGIQHHRVLEFGDHLADDVYALGFELFEMGKLIGVHEGHFEQRSARQEVHEINRAASRKHWRAHSADENPTSHPAAPVVGRRQAEPTQRMANSTGLLDKRGAF